MSLFVTMSFTVIHNLTEHCSAQLPQIHFRTASSYLPTPAAVGRSGLPLLLPLPCVFPSVRQQTAQSEQRSATPTVCPSQSSTPSLDFKDNNSNSG